LITFPDFLQRGIEISLFSFLGFLLYERISKKVVGKEAESRRSIRRFAMYYLTSTFLLFLAYFLGYARGNAWLVSLSDAYTLRSLEGVAAFFGVVIMLIPLYPIGRMLSADIAISDVYLPELSQTVAGGMLILIYLGLLYAETISPQTLSLRIMESAFLVGITGIIVGMFFAKQTTLGDKTKTMLFLLCICPWITLGVLGVVHILGFL
jgi:hypothetical protein